MTVQTSSTRAEPKHPIQIVSRRTDLSADVLRAWERRYKAVQPQRSASGRRLYSDADISRLSLLRRATLSGRSIAQVAKLPDDRLRDLVAADAVDHRGAALSPPIADPDDADAYLRRALAAVDGDRAGELHNVLLAAADALGPRVTTESVLRPFLERIMRSWPEADAAVTVRNLASALTRSLQEKRNGA
jgi:DNA-binding transcriptional MerR regulator